MVLGWLYGKKEVTLPYKIGEFHQELEETILEIENSRNGDRSRDETKPDLCLILITPQNEGKNRHLFHHTSKTIEEAIREETKDKYGVYKLGKEKVGLIVPIEKDNINSGSIFGYGRRLKERVEKSAKIDVYVGISVYPTNARTKDLLVESAEMALDNARYSSMGISLL